MFKLNSVSRAGNFNFPSFFFFFLSFFSFFTWTTNNGCNKVEWKLKDNLIPLLLGCKEM